MGDRMNLPELPNNSALNRTAPATGLPVTYRTHHQFNPTSGTATTKTTNRITSAPKTPPFTPAT